MAQKKTQQSLADNPHVKEMFSVLKENDKDTAGLTALLGYMKQMEDYVKSAEGQISDMKAQMTEIKEIQKHPIKTALKDASQSLKARVSGIRAQLEKLRANIAEACKNALSAVKRNGITTLDKLASFFNVKQGFEAIQKDTVEGMKSCDKSVAKIERFSKEYHTTGRALKNMVRLVIGKDPIDTSKEIGKLAKAICSPYMVEKKCLSGICNAANKAIAKLEDLGKNADEIRNERKERKQQTLDEKLAACEEKAKLHNEKVGKIVDFKPKEQEEVVA